MDENAMSLFSARIFARILQKVAKNPRILKKIVQILAKISLRCTVLSAGEECHVVDAGVPCG